MEFLYEVLEKEFGKRSISNVEVPDLILDNLRPGYGRRPYQIEAFQRFLLCLTEDFTGKPGNPLHILYNMATGSGKTLIMAGLILYLYNRGYRDFMFFVNSNNIITKTQENFLNPFASKYLFNKKILVDGREVFVKEVSNYDEADKENINIKFTTIQQLHIDLNNPRENGVSYEDFAERRLVLIADEAHHLNKSTRQRENSDKPSWENTVAKLLDMNKANMLLEFTATLDNESKEIVEKYKDKVIFKYDLAQFRIDKYSKEINLIRTMYEEKERILQALILNLYRQELAAKHYINLKPVILFKAKRTIEESENNKKKFHYLIDNLTPDMVENIRNSSTVDIIKKAYHFFDQVGLSYQDVTTRLKSHFRMENCLSANNDKEAELNQIRLNTLEDEDNPIRAIFAVQKLVEGWDVLNLFDIVRLYEGRDGRENKPGKTTISEAQLIGRGARYYPFAITTGQDPYTRKFDEDITNDLKILEELYYHTKEDSRYINELKNALIATGIFADNLIIKSLIMKDEFKESDFYDTGLVFYNERIVKSYDNIKSFKDLGVVMKNHSFLLASGSGKVMGVFSKDKSEDSAIVLEQKEIPLSEVPNHVIRYGLEKNPYFYFSNLEKIFPNVGSTSDFIKSKDYLGGLKIVFNGTKDRLNSLTKKDYLDSTISLLKAIESEIKSNTTEYEGSEFKSDSLKDVFKNKDIKVVEGSKRAEGQEELVKDKSWYVYNANYGTSEEKDFVELFSRWFDAHHEKFSYIYLVRNERELKIYDNLGRPFEPDFLLFCNHHNGKEVTYQVFIEPKGAHLKEHDKWKEDFLRELKSQKKTISIVTGKYIITGVPFYNNKTENEFTEALNDVLL